MNETIRGIYRNGVIEPAEPLKVAEGAEVYVVVPRRYTREETLALYKKNWKKTACKSITIPTILASLFLKENCIR